MRGRAPSAGIRCPIDLFPKQEAAIAESTDALNRARTATAKAPHARALIEAVGVLLACGSYDEGNMNCRLCRNFSELRRKTADLIVRVASQA